MKGFVLLFSTFVLAACGGEQEANNNSPNESEETAEVKDADSQETTNDDLNYQTTIDQEYLNEFEDIDNDMKEEIENHTYTVDSPYVSLDPYGTAPLTALVAFETENPTRAVLTIEGKTEETTMTHDFEEMNTSHQLPVLGLYPGETNQVQVSLFDSNDNLIRTKEIAIETEPLPENFWSLDLAVQSNEQAMEEGLTFLIPSAGNLFAVDSLGDVRYYIKPWMSNTFNKLDNGNIQMALSKGRGVPYNQLVEMNRLGKPEQAVLLEIDHFDRTDLFHHDVIELPNDNWLAPIHDGSGDYIEDEMVEMNNESGEIVDHMNFKDVFSAPFYENYEGPYSEEGDWFHQNSVEMTRDEESILVSSRHQDMVMKLSYPDMETEWVLAADENWPEQTNIRDYLLEPVNDSVKFPTAQHAVEELPDQDDDPDTMDIMLFDNNKRITRGNEETSEEYSRAVQYRVNEVEGTVEEIDSYGEERGTSFYSSVVGDADFQPDTENVLITSGRIENEGGDNPESRIVEVAGDDKEVVFELVVSRFADRHGDRSQVYRAERFPLYPN